MNNVDIDYVRFSKDECGNLTPRINGYLTHCAVGENSDVYWLAEMLNDSCENLEESYWW